MALSQRWAPAVEAVADPPGRGGLQGRDAGISEHLGVAAENQQDQAQSHPELPAEQGPPYTFGRRKNLTLWGPSAALLLLIYVEGRYNAMELGIDAPGGVIAESGTTRRSR